MTRPYDIRLKILINGIAGDDPLSIAKIVYDKFNKAIEPKVHIEEIQITDIS